MGALAGIELQIRRLQTGEVVVAEFDSPAAAAAWLRERPAFVEVQRLVTALPPELEATLRAAMRPLDADEIALVQQREAEKIQQLQQLRTEAQARITAEQPPDDPLRPMVVRWSRERGMWLPDDEDDRPIPPFVEAAVRAWIDERNSWVRGRDQHVATAIVTVDLGPNASGNDLDRIQPGGQFVTAPGATTVDES